VLADRAVATLAEAGAAPPPPPAAAAAAVLDRLDHWDRARARDGFGVIRAAWLRHAQPLGTRLSLRRGETEIQGSFAGLTEDGGLLLQTGDGLRAYATGEVLSSDGRPAVG
jgi:BirA family transcriptional regulator, biotin operon repressor / biotin---[acetyl-CoA-carboxylase] ligase